MANPNGLNPNVACMSFLGGTPLITGGGCGTNATIAAEILPLVGVPGNGSVYISYHSGSPGLWVLIAGAWKWLASTTLATSK